MLSGELPELVELNPCSTGKHHCDLHGSLPARRQHSLPLSVCHGLPGRWTQLLWYKYFSVQLCLILTSGQMLAKTAPLRVSLTVCHILMS